MTSILRTLLSGWHALLCLVLGHGSAVHREIEDDWDADRIFDTVWCARCKRRIW